MIRVYEVFYLWPTTAAQRLTARRFVFWNNAISSTLASRALELSHLAKVKK